jgi:hypothetical protein
MQPVLGPVSGVRSKTQERQKQVLRLTTPKLKDVRGPFRSATVLIVKLGLMEKRKTVELFSSFPQPLLRVDMD